MADDLKLPATLYESDFYAWALEQGTALRLAAKGGKADGGLDLDWLNLAEEIEDMGRSEKRAYESYCQMIVLHLFKLAYSQREQAKPGWRHEILVFRDSLRKYESRTIRALTEAGLDALHERAFRLATSDMAAYEPGVVLPDPMHWTLAQIVGDAPDGVTAGLAE